MKRIYDRRLVNRVLRHPEVVPYVNYGQPVPDDWFPPEDAIYLYEPGRLFPLLWDNGLWIHAACTPGHRGTQAVAAARRAFAWVFENTNQNRLRASVWKGNRHANIFARRTGMTHTHKDKEFDYFEIRGERLWPS